MAKLTNHVQRNRFITSSTDKHYSHDSEDDFRSGCRNVSHQQQFFSELLSPDDHNIERFHSRGQLTCKFTETKGSVYIWKEFNSQRIGLVHQRGRRFIARKILRLKLWKHPNFSCASFANTNDNKHIISG